MFGMNMNDSLILACYKTFIESVLSFHICTVFGHLNVAEKEKLQRVVRNAAKLGNITTDSIGLVYEMRIAKRCHSIKNSNDSVLEMERLPSGRFRVPVFRTNLRKFCFRSMFSRYMNN